MRKVEAKWVVHAKRADFKAIGAKFNIDQVTARVIRNRDVVGDEAIHQFLYGDLSSVNDFSLMADIDKASQIIKEKIENKKKIRIISDYDVDGMMSNYILYDALKKLGADVSYDIPDRKIDGYGLNERLILKAYEDGVDTIITCDNGIAAFDEIEMAVEKGMTVVVTDHHEVPYDIDENTGNKKYKLPPAQAVIDIKREDCDYPYKEICGATVAYKFIKNLYKLMETEFEDENEYIEYVAIATVCDVMNLKDENRVYVRKGLEILERTKNIGLKSLLEINSLLDKKITTYHLGFVIGPCFNAAGRIGDASLGVKLLCAENSLEGMKIAEEIFELNIKRKEMTEAGTGLAFEIIEIDYSQDNVIVVYVPNVDESIVGIIAGRIKEKLYRPCIVFTDGNDGILKGSARSIEGYNLFEELSKFKSLLNKFGGHELAAGMSIDKDKIDDLREALNANHTMTEEILTPVVRLDVAMPIDYISIALVEDLEKLMPYGTGNERPIFGQTKLRIKNGRLLGEGDKFIKLTFMDENGYTIEGMDFDANNFLDLIKLWFSQAECDKILKGSPNSVLLDVIYYPEINEYMGRRTLQIRPISYRKSN